MKKIVLFCLLLCGAFAVFAETPETAENTWYYSFKINYTTPYGVPLLDADGNEVKDERGSTVIVFEMRRTAENQLLRVQYNSNGIGELSFLKKGSKNEKGEYVIEWIPANGKLVFLKMDDGKYQGFATLEYTVSDRGLGVTPATCKLYGVVTDYTIDDNGFKVPTKIEGDLAGFSDGDDSGAWGLVENATDLKPDAILSVIVNGGWNTNIGPVKLTQKQILTYVRSGYYW